MGYAAGYLRTVAALLASVSLAACTATLHGHQSSAGGSTATGAGVAASAGAAGVRAQASFGSPAPVQGAGGQAVFSRGASAVLFLGLVLADMVYHMAHGYAPGSERAPATSIADTCSCYRPQPEPMQPQARTDEPGER